MGIVGLDSRQRHAHEEGNEKSRKGPPNQPYRDANEITQLTPITRIGYLDGVQ